VKKAIVIPLIAIAIAIIQLLWGDNLLRSDEANRSITPSSAPLYDSLEVAQEKPRTVQLSSADKISISVTFKMIGAEKTGSIAILSSKGILIQEPLFKVQARPSEFTLNGVPFLISVNQINYQNNSAIISITQ